MPELRAVPLTVIGGFLGAGKTTLLNALLAQIDNRRIAVLVNDFGDLQIDAALIEKRNTSTIGLRNGCVCCSLAGGLVNALSDVLALNPRPDHVVVEASGVSDPRRIAQVARTGAGFSPEATVVVVAADQIETLATDRYVGDTVAAQLAAADLLVLNKVDLVDAPHRQRVGEWLTAHAPHAALNEACNGDVPIEIALGPMGRSGLFRGVNNNDHSDRFAAHVFRRITPVSETKLRHVLSQLPRGILRLKGFVRLDSNPQQPRLVQGVGTRCTISDVGSSVGSEGSALVVIGARAQLSIEDLMGFRELFEAAELNELS